MLQKKKFWSLEIVTKTYEHAKETLHACFCHKQQTVQNHMESLLNLQYSPNNTVAPLRKIFDTCWEYSRKTMGVCLF